MKAVLFNAFPGMRKLIEKPYTIKINKKTGALYLKREQSSLFKEAPYAVALFIAAAFAIYSCCGHIKLWTDVNCRIKRLEQLERQMITLKNDNELMQRRYESMGDLNYVYEVATQTLGMVPVSEENVIYYEYSDSEYVYQRDDIPSNELN